MKLLEDKILKDGVVLPGDVLKVDSFLNHQINVMLLSQMAEYIYNHFKDCKVDKVLTVEASGIALACLTAQFFCCPLVFAKKSKTANMQGDSFVADVYSYTHKTMNHIEVTKKYLSVGENVLIVDDFLANGEASKGLISLVNQANAKVVGVACAIEKCYQGGGDSLREQGIDVLALAAIDKMEDGKITFRNS